jgi:pimeloyl-ACP methyl ester carboxylesterase
MAAVASVVILPVVSMSRPGFAAEEPAAVPPTIADLVARDAFEADDALAGEAEAAAVDEEGDDERCARVTFQVSLDPSLPDVHSMVGDLCRPARGRARTLQILLHGASFNRGYWDFPLRPRRYSYVRHANAAGFGTLALDRLGTGESDRPPPELVTVHASASTIHQIVTAIRGGEHRDEVGRRLRFDRIVLVGNSFGSNISWTEAGIYGDVDGLILTGISHDQNPPAAPLTQLYAYPAQLDPLFVELALPSGYITTIPTTRAELFFHLPGASPAVIALDETLKDTLPVGMLFDQFTTYELTQNIHVPVLNVVGDFDTLSCQLPSCTESGSIANEGSHYPADACYTQVIVPNAGHALNLHRNAPSWYRRAQRWVERAVEGGECDALD